MIDFHTDFLIPGKDWCHRTGVIWKTFPMKVLTERQLSVIQPPLLNSSKGYTSLSSVTGIDLLFQNCEGRGNGLTDQPTDSQIPMRGDTDCLSMFNFHWKHSLKCAKNNNCMALVRKCFLRRCDAVIVSRLHLIQINILIVSTVYRLNCPGCCATDSLALLISFIPRLLGIVPFVT